MQLSVLMQNSWSLLKVSKIKIHSYNQLQLKLMLLYSDVWQPQVTIKFIYVIANIFSHHQIVSTFCSQDLNTMHQFMCNHHVQHTKVRSCHTTNQDEHSTSNCVYNMIVMSTDLSCRRQLNKLSCHVWCSTELRGRAELCLPCLTMSQH